MTAFVLDVAMRWHQESEKPPNQEYVEAVIGESFRRGALASNLWHIEMTDLWLGVESRGDT